MADGQAKTLEEVSTSDRELTGDAARIGRPEELFGSAIKRKRPSRHRVIMLRGVVCGTLGASCRPRSLLSSHSTSLLMRTTAIIQLLMCSLY